GGNARPRPALGHRARALVLRRGAALFPALDLLLRRARRHDLRLARRLLRRVDSRVPVDDAPAPRLLPRSARRGEAAPLVALDARDLRPGLDLVGDRLADPAGDRVPGGVRSERRLRRVALLDPRPELSARRAARASARQVGRLRALR